MSNISTGEPALTTSTITSLVAAAIALLVSFGLPLSGEQTVAITAVVAILAPLVSGFVTRRQVTPSKEVAVQVAPSGEYVAAEGLTGVENGTVLNLQEAA